MSDTDVRFVFLMRALGPKESLVFSTYLFIDEGGPDLYVATLAGMDGRLVATGTNEDEACFEALDLFKAMVDHALEQKQPIERVVGELVFKRLPASIEDGPKLFQMLGETLGKRPDEGDEWREFPMPAARLEEVAV